MKENQRQWLLAICSFLTAGLILSAVILQYAYTKGSGIRSGGTGMFRMFTNDGNLFSALAALSCGIYSAYCAVRNKSMDSRVIYSLRLMSAVSETVIFLIVVAVLMPMGMNMLLSGYSLFVLHAAAPFVTVISFALLDPRPKKIGKAGFLWGALPVFLYGLIVLILCLAKVWTGNLIPYPFFRVYDNPVWLTVAAMAGIIAVTLLLSFGLDRIRAGRKAKGQETEKP